MAKPSAVIPQWAVTANFGSTNYPPKILSTDPTAAASMTTWITLVSAATAVAAPTDFGEILHPNAGAGTPWSLTANKEATGLAAFANTGFEPALPVKAESWNQWLANIWEYVDWLRLASSAADLDDHVVQTDATGATALAKILAGGTALADSAAVFTSNSAGACVSITDTIGQFALLVAGSSALAGIRTTQTGTGSAIEAILSGGSATGSALSGDAGPVGAFGVDGDGGTTGVGVRGVGGGTSGDGVVGDGNVAGHGVSGTGGGTTGAGVFGTSSTSASPGIQGTNTNTNGIGLEGSTVALATVSATAVRGITGTGNATAVKGDASAGDGYGVLAFADTTAPVSAPLRLVPQNADPSVGADGDISPNSTRDQLRAHIDGGWQGLWSTTEGLGFAHAEATAAATTSSGTYVNRVTLTMLGTSAIEPDGDYIVEWSCLVSNSGGSNPEILVRFTGPGAFSEFVNIKLPTIGDWHSVSFRKKFTYGGGSETWTLDWHSGIGAQVVDMKEASIVARGAY